MRYIGVLLNSSVDGLDGRYSPQRDDLEDFAEDLEIEPLPDMEPEGD